MTHLHVQRAGVGPPTSVWLHGWGMHGGIWRTVAEGVAEDGAEDVAEDVAKDIAKNIVGEALFVDLPGHGHSPADACDAGRADAIADAVAKVAPPDSVVVGWSLGGLVAIELALRHPGLVSRLVLVGCNPHFTATTEWPHGMEPGLLRSFGQALVEDYEGTLRRFLALQVLGGEAARATLAELRALLDAAPRPAPGALAAGLELLSRTSLIERLGEIRVPVTFVQGEHDTVAPAAAAIAAARLVPDAKVHVIPGAGHAPFLSHPAAFRAVVDEALRW